MKNYLKISRRQAICMVIAAVAAAGYSCKKDDKEETSGYIHHSGHSYLVVKERKTWQEAVADAKSKGGYLAEIGSQEEQGAIYRGIGEAGVSATYAAAPDGGGTAYVWIGATDKGTEGKWVWNETNTTFWNGSGETGSAANGSYHNWGGKAAGSLNEPDNYPDGQNAPNGQNAAAIALAKWPAGVPVELGKAGEWNDIAETNKLYYVIEFDSEK